MPIEYLWVLVISLAMMAFGCALKAAELFHRLKMSDKELSRLFADIDILNKDYKKQISSISERHEKEIDSIFRAQERSRKKLIDKFYEHKKPPPMGLIGLSGLTNKY